MTKELTDSNAVEFFGQEKPIVIKAWATWCGPCRAYGPTFDQASEDTLLSDDYDFLTLDVDNNPETATKLGIIGIPATVVYKNGAEVSKFSGVKSLDGLTEYLITK